MTKIKDILSIHLEEDIKSVIDLNQQDEQSVIDELDGFILTESLAKHLADFCDFYTSNTAQPGLWLSGFYGSGKSYFSKMIGFLLKNPTIKGTSIHDRFANKLIGLPNASLLQNSINELGRTKNHIVLFDAAKTTGNHGISYMMMGAFLKSLNLNDDWVGIVEFNLLMSGRYQQFCDKVQQKFGEAWLKRRKNMDQVYDTLEDTMLDGFCSESAYDEMRDAAKQRIQDYDANKLQEDLTRYLDQNQDIRIVFMIDEVSEAIAQQKINILDLEGMAEAIAALGRKIWTIAIAQLQLDDVINGTNVNRSLLTKIIDRFRKRIPIAAEEVDTIIRKRLLAKTAEGNDQLQAYYKKKSGQISDITNIVGTGLNKTTDAQTYADYYPFYEHQFKMLQYFLFGTQKLVKTQVGTRGMLISAFDVLKKEALSDRDMYTHVNASQLCRQAEEAVAESLRVRYNQADEHLTDLKLKFVGGHDMLQTIHFLTESGAKTTVENISRAYVSCPDDYFTVLEEVKKACKKLSDDEILILSGDEYRITSETQQRIFEMMANYDGIATYRIKGEITKEVKKMQLVRQAQNLTVDSINVSFTVQSDSGETFSTGGDQGMKVVFHDILSVKPSLSEYVDKVKEDTQSDKNVISIIPSPDYASEIQQIAETILRINYIKDVPNLTPEEKKVVDEIANTLEDKTSQLEQAIIKSYTEGRLVYLYNASILKPQNASQLIKENEQKMYGNIYTKRLGRLKERCSSVQKDYEITFTYDDKNTVTGMTWTQNPEKSSLRSSGEGKYLVQTSLKGYSEKQIWEFYNVIRRVETVFETLKTDLDIRPVYHQTDEAIKAHFNLAVLAYWIVSTTQYQLRRKGSRMSWQEVMRIAGTQIVVSTIAKRIDGNQVEVRQCTEPEKQLSDLYKKLDLTSPPLKRRRKICVVHFSELKKNDT